MVMNRNRNIGHRHRAYNHHNRGYANRNRQNFNSHRAKPWIPHVVFDMIQAESAFPRVKPAPVKEVKELNDVILKRVEDLIPNAALQANLLKLLDQVQTVLDKLVLTPSELEACQIEEVKQVGSYKKGTLLVSPKLVADICVVLKTLPTKEAVNQMAIKVNDELKKTSNSPELLKTTLNNRGFEISILKSDPTQLSDLAVQVLITTQQQNHRKLDPALHLDNKICHQNLMSIKHVRWFEDNASNVIIKTLVRIFKDIQKRYEGLMFLSPWSIDLLVHYAFTNGSSPNAPMTLVSTFKRVFQLISAGFFLPGSVGIIDPLEQTITRVHTTMTLEHQDAVCNTFQTLLRVLSHGGYKQILGMEDTYVNVAITNTMWPVVNENEDTSMYDTIITVQPGQVVYENKENMESQSQSQQNQQEGDDCEANDTAGLEDDEFQMFDDSNCENVLDSSSMIMSDTSMTK